MARPIKTKIDYFPIDCNDDERMKLIELKHGLVAYAVFVKLLQKIYGNKGYYADWNEDTALLFSGEHGIELKTLNDIITDMLKRGIFDAEMYEKHSILTSREIQEQYFFVIAKRRQKEINESYCLINVTKTGVNAAKTGVIVSKSTHSIGEDSIVEDSIGEGASAPECNREGVYADSRCEENMHKTPPPTQKKSRGEFNNVILTEAEYEALSAEYGDITQTIERLSQYMAATGKRYVSHYAVLKKWAEEDKAKQPKNADNSSYDINEFFELALKHSNEKMLSKR